MQVKSRSLIVMAAACGLLAQLARCGTAAAESPEVTEAFSRLDALAEELAARRRALGDVPGTASAPAPASPPVPGAASAAASASPPDSAEGARGRSTSPSNRDLRAPAVAGQGKEVPCASRPEMAEMITGLRQRYGEHGKAIIGVNDEVPAFREGVLDLERVCTDRLANEVASARARVEVLDLEADHRVVGTLTTCVDRLREKTDDDLSAATSNIRMQRLAAEMERLGSMTHRVADLERALLRGISKRDRLVLELGQFQQEIEAACRWADESMNRRCGSEVSWRRRAIR